MRLLHLFAAMLAPAAALAQPSLTVYNQNFAVIHDTVRLSVKRGENQVRYAGATALVEPSSVILRASGLRILEQSYRADPLSMETLLRQNEGRVLDFLVQEGGQTRVVQGRLVRAGGVPPMDPAAMVMRPYIGPQPMMPQPAMQPLVEVQGKLRFQLPGTPLFDAPPADSILTPALEWRLEAASDASVDAEVGYVTGGLNWEADYNFSAPESGGDLDVAGWVTIRNHSGRTFEQARVKLMAGDVNKVQPALSMMAMGGVIGGIAGGLPGAPPVSEKTFDDYHLYTLDKTTTLRDRETKQVEFLRAAGVKAKAVYLYDGLQMDRMRQQQYPPEMVRQDSSYGTQSNPRVWIMREFANSTANRMGMPLPQGRVRFYRRDSDGRLEFTGEDTIRHTPRDETVRVFTGAAFDLVGERKRMSFRIDHAASMVEESFEIRVRNRKREPVEVIVLEHLYRWVTWEIFTSSQPFRKTESRTAECTLALAPGEEKVVTYSVRYRW